MIIEAILVSIDRAVFSPEFPVDGRDFRYSELVGRSVGHVFIHVLS